MGPEARSLRNCRRPVAAAPTAPQATLRPKLRSRRQRHEHTTSRREWGAQRSLPQHSHNPKKEQTALSLQSKSKRMLVHRRSGRCTKNTYQNRLRLSPHTSAGTEKRQYQLASLGALATRGRAPTCPTQAQSRGRPGLQMPLSPADSLVG
eukprot:gene1063-633_t